MTHHIHELVREQYAASATAVLDSGGCCAPEPGIRAELYSTLERDELP